MEVPRFPRKVYTAVLEDRAEKKGERVRIMEGAVAFNKDPVGTLERMK